MQKEYDLLSTGKVEKQLLQARGFQYEHGEKAGRLLAHQFKAKSTSQQISQIKNVSDDVTVIPSEINDTFRDYYSNLYKSESPTNNTDMEKFLDGLIFPNIDNGQERRLDQPLNASEILGSIKAIQSGEAPGPDGFPTEFFKEFSDKL